MATYQAEVQQLGEELQTLIDQYEQQQAMLSDEAKKDMFQWFTRYISLMGDLQQAPQRRGQLESTLEPERAREPRPAAALQSGAAYPAPST